MKGKHYVKCVICNRKRALPSTKVPVCRRCPKREDFEDKMKELGFMQLDYLVRF
ncbi:MAG TPA: hypothetical protein VF884_07780 [Nitrososphaeraceae archaeon]